MVRCEGEPIGVPKSNMRPRKSRKSAEYKMEEEWVDDELLATPDIGNNNRVEVRFSGLNFEYNRSLSPLSMSDETDSKYNDNDSNDSSSRRSRRRWSRELEVGLKTAVEGMYVQCL